jgi:hypothetical protein
VVVDNSLRMQYVHQNRTRLEQATETAADLVAKFPEDATVAVCDLGRAASGFAPDLSAAASRLRNLRATAGARSLTAVIIEAINLVAEQADRRQECSCSPISSAAWSEDGVEAIARALACRTCGSMCSTRVATARASLGELNCGYRSCDLASRAHQAAVMSDAARRRSGADLVNEEGRSEKARALVGSHGKGQARSTYSIASGSVKLTAADPLAVDNTRYFTVEVAPACVASVACERDTV